MRETFIAYLCPVDDELVNFFYIYKKEVLFEERQREQLATFAHSHPVRIKVYKVSIN